MLSEKAQQFDSAGVQVQVEVDLENNGDSTTEHPAKPSAGSSAAHERLLTTEVLGFANLLQRIVRDTYPGHKFLPRSAATPTCPACQQEYKVGLETSYTTM